ncbi:MAG: hypothetical protein K1W35_13010 [Lachnospiraceae bacterium]
MKWLNICKSIKDYDKYNVEDLEKINKRLSSEFRRYHKKAYSKMISNSLTESEITDFYELEEDYTKEISKLEYIINNKKGIYSFCDSNGKLIDAVIRNDFLTLQKYKLPIKIKLYIKETRKDYDMEYEDVIDIDKIIGLIKELKLRT